jgi:chemotaxis protein CheD
MNFTDSHHIHVIGGQYAVSADPDTVLMTVLGSCVSACIYDTTTSIGGMNHFILPTSGGLEIIQHPERYGDLAMRALVDDLCSLGAERRDLRAKLFGGRTRKCSGYDPGLLNAAFARRFLQAEGIKLVDSSLGDDLARWIAFHPTTGSVQMRITAATVPAPSTSRIGDATARAARY